jgi:hypothetical protein
MDRLLRLKPYQRMNHFPGMAVIARKNQLGKTLNVMQRRFPREYDFYPLTWLLPGDGNEFRQFLLTHTKNGKGGKGPKKENNQDDEDETPKSKQAFIVKPEASC